jgi:hypothetical protein
MQEDTVVLLLYLSAEAECIQDSLDLTLLQGSIGLLTQNGGG